MNSRIFLAMLAATAIGVTAVQAATSVSLKSVNVTLPEPRNMLPDGPNVAVVHDNCVTCHSPAMILNQPALPRAAWEAEVAKMRGPYKAPVDAKDVAAIVDYLVAIKGAK